MSTPHPEGWLGEPKEIHDVDPTHIVGSGGSSSETKTGGNAESKTEQAGASSAEPAQETTISSTKEPPTTNQGSAEAEGAAVTESNRAKGWLGDPKEIHEVDPTQVVGSGGSGGGSDNKAESKTTAQAGSGSAEPTSSAAEPPASNPGTEDAAGGIAKESGGVSGAAESEAAPTGAEETGATTTTASSTTLLGTVKSYLGFGGSEGTTTATTTTTTTQETTQHTQETSADDAAEGKESQQTMAGAAVSYVASTVTVAATAVQDRVGVPATTATQEEGQEEAVASEEAATTTTASATASAQQFINNTAERVKQVAAPYASESGDPAEVVAGNDSSTADAADATTEDTKETGAASGGSGKGGKPLENKSAIPTAGGERLGEKHWGESDIVPDVPKLRPEDDAEGGKGISSADGQPTDEVKANTASNMGGATEAPRSAEEGTGRDGNAAAAAAVSTDDNKVEGAVEKEKLIDKIKDKLHIGKKDKE